MTTTYATDTYAGDGTETEFDLTFQLISRDHLEVVVLDDADGAETALSVIDTGSPVGNEYRWENDTRIKVGVAPTAEQTIRLRRKTPENQQLVQWRDGSYIIAEDLNTSEEQSLYLDQELDDRLTSLEILAFKYFGFIDVTTDKAPANPTNGTFYVNTGTGNVRNSWTGIVGDPVVGAEQVVFNSTTAKWEIFQTPSSQSGVNAIAGSGPITIDGSNPSVPIVGINTALIQFGLTQFLYDSSNNLFQPGIGFGVGSVIKTLEYHEGSGIGGGSYEVCASNSAADMGRDFYTAIDHVTAAGQVLKLIPDSLNSIKASQAGCRYQNPLDGGYDDTVNLQTATNFTFDTSGTTSADGSVEQPKGAVVYIEGTIFITDTIFSRSGRVTYIGTNWKATGFKWAGGTSTQPMFNMGYSSTGGFRDVGLVANSNIWNPNANDGAGAYEPARAAYCIACDFTDLGFELTRCYLGAASCDLFILFRSFKLTVGGAEGFLNGNPGSGYSNGDRVQLIGGNGSGMLANISVNSSGAIVEAELAYVGDFKYSPADANSIIELDSNNDPTTVTDYQKNDIVTVSGGDGNAQLKLQDVDRDNAITNLTFQNCFLAIASDRNGYVVKCESGAGGKRPISFASCTVIANNEGSSRAGGLLNAVAAKNKGFAVNVHSCRFEYQKENSIYDSTNFALVNVDCDSTSASQRTSIKLSGCVGFISDYGWQRAYIARGTTSGSISLTYDGNLSGFGGIYYSDVSEDFAPKLTSTSTVSNAGGLFNDVQFGKSSIISVDFADKNQSNDGWWITRGDICLTSDGVGDYLTSGIEDKYIYSLSATGFQNVGKGTGSSGGTELIVPREVFSAIRLRPNLAIRVIGGGAGGANLDTKITYVNMGNEDRANRIGLADALGSDVTDASIQPIGAPVRQGWLSPRSTLPTTPSATTGQSVWSQDLQAQAYWVQKDIHITTGEESSVNKWVWGPTRAVTTAERNAIDYTNNRRAFVGSCVFDITLGQPVWWNKTGWVDANGNTIGYGAVTQLINKATGVTVNAPSGAITTHNASLADNAEVTFTVTNSSVTASDVVSVSVQSGASTGLYLALVSATAAGSFDVTLSNLGSTAGEVVVVNFAVMKAAAS